MKHIRPSLLLAPALASTMSLGLAQEAVHPLKVASEPEGAAGTEEVLQQLEPGAILRESRKLLFDEPGDGKLWARGTTYKASFGAQGFTFIPFLDPEAPQSYPLHMDLTAVTVEAQPLGLAPPAKAQRDGRSVRLDRGSVVEQYHLEETSLEQTFVFDALPERGEMVIQLAVDTEFAVRADGAGGWYFENSHGQMHYGAATAIDAAGASLALEQRWGDAGLEIVVPADFVAQAELPLVVDPVLTPTTVVSDGDSQISVDIAYDPQNNLYMIVFEEFLSLSDRDVFSAFFDPTLGIVTSFASIDITSARWGSPAIANCYNDQTFLVVSSVGATIGSRQIWGRTRIASNGITGPQFSIAGGFTDNALPDVGGYGNDVNTSFDFCVVWQRGNNFGAEADIVSRGVSSSGNLVGSTVEIANVSGETDQHPRISQTTGPIELTASEHCYMVVWEREQSASNHDILARVVDYDNDITGHPRFTAYNFSDALDPDVSAQARNLNLSPDPYFVIVFERLLGSDYDIFAIVAQDGDADNARNVSVMQDLAVQDEQADPKVTFEGTDYLIVYNTEASGGGLDGMYTALNVVSDGNELRTGLCERRDNLRPLDGSMRDLAITTDYYSSFAQPSTVGMAAWVANGNFGTDGDVAIAEVQEFTTNNIGSQYCDATPNSTGTSAWIRTYGVIDQNPDSTLFVETTDLPPNQFAQYLTAMGNTVTQNPGGSTGDLCLSGAVGRFSSQIGSTGALGEFTIGVDPTALPQPAGTVSALAGQTWFFQCWVRDVQFGSPTSNFSNGIGVTFL